MLRILSQILPSQRRAPAPANRTAESSRDPDDRELDPPKPLSSTPRAARGPREQLLSSLQRVPCNLCGIDDTTTLVDESPAPLVRCNRCGLAYYSPQPTEPALRAYYSSEMDGTYTPQLREWYGELTPERVQALTAELRSCESWLGPVAPGEATRFLEVGCAFGHQLYCAKQLGWEPVGIEVSGPAAEWVRSELGLNIFHGIVEEVAGRLAEGSFDLALMSHVLEHVPNPSRTVRTLARLLKPGGVLVISVPNGQGLQARHDFAGWEWKCFPDHLYYFGPTSLTRLLTDCGLRLEQMWTCLGHSDRRQIFGLIQDRLLLDGPEQAEAFVEVLGQQGLLSDLRAVARKPGQ